MDETTDKVGKCLGTKLDEPGGNRLIYTSSGTEANNLVLRGLGNVDRLIVSEIEHPSVLSVAKWIQSRGKKLDLLTVSSSGFVCLV